MTPSQFMSLLFEIEIVTHLEHLKSKTLTHGKHETLNDLYQDIVGLRDRWAEAYQGKYGLLSEINVSTEDKGEDIVKYLNSCASEIETFYLKIKVFIPKKSIIICTIQNETKSIRMPIPEVDNLDCAICRDFGSPFDVIISMPEEIILNIKTIPAAPKT